MNLVRLAVAAVAAVVFLGSMQTASAQVPNANLALQIAAARRQNNTLLHQYSWTCRTELIDNGKVADIRLDMVNWGPDGNIQRSLINDSGAPLPSGFLRRAIAENQKKKVETYLNGLRGLLDQYTLPSAGKILDFVSQSQVVNAQGPGGVAMLEMIGASVVTPGDTFTLFVDPTSFQARQIQITTTFEGDPVNATATFKTSPTGLTYMSFAEVTVPAKSMTLQVQNFDHEKSN